MNTQNPNIIVTGGAGYVGSHICKALALAGFTPITLDNLNGGHAELVKWGPLEMGDISDAAWLGDMFRKHTPQAVIHCAGLISVAESMQYPERYFHHNTRASQILLDVMQTANIKRIIFSSSASVYGKCTQMPIAESQPCDPENPYAESKWQTEEAIRRSVDAHGFSAMILRYFNAAGADAEGETGEMHNPETHLIPLAIQAALGGTALTVYGTRYDTPDGTAIRDYIHVSDLANAHISALRYILAQEGSHTLNLGSGTGNSVGEMLKITEEMCGSPIIRNTTEARAGDVPILVADIQKARNILAFHPQFSSPENIIATALAWHKKLM